MPSKKILLAGLFIIICVSAAVFRPALGDVPKADHIAYLIETAGLDNFSDLMTYTYSYARSRILLSGDKILFRPLFYAALSLEKFFFGYNFALWQVFGFLLHVCVLILLLRLFSLIRGGPENSFLAVLFVLLFSVQCTGLDAVSWHHITPYLLCFIFILLSQIHLFQYQRAVLEPGKNAGAPVMHIWVMAVYLTLACLTNEYSLGACLTIFFAARIVRPAGPAHRHLHWILLLPVAVYWYLSLLDYSLRFPGVPFLTQAQASYASIAHNPLRMLAQFSIVLFAVLIIPLTPGFFFIHAAERNYLVIYYGKGFRDFVAAHPVSFTANIVLLLLFSAFIVLLLFNAGRVKDKGQARPKAKDPALILAVLNCCLLLWHISLFTLVRASDRSLSYLSNGLYYFYPMTLFCLCATFGMWCAVERQLVYKRRWVLLLLVLTLTLAAFLNAEKRYYLNKREAALYAPWKRYMKQLDAFVRKHRREPGFSFVFEDRDSARPVRIFMDTGGKRVDLFGNVSDLLFRKYMYQDNPSYRLNYKNGVLKKITDRL